jgi:hypothetical protein
MSWQQRQIVATVVIAMTLIAIYLVAQRGISWSLMVRTIGDASWVSW